MDLRRRRLDAKPGPGPENGGRFANPIVQPAASMWPVTDGLLLEMVASPGPYSHDSYPPPTFPPVFLIRWGVTCSVFCIQFGRMEPRLLHPSEFCSRAEFFCSSSDRNNCRRRTDRFNESL